MTSFCLFCPSPPFRVPLQLVIVSPCLSPDQQQIIEVFLHTAEKRLKMNTIHHEEIEVSSKPMPPPFPFVECWSNVFKQQGLFLGRLWLSPPNTRALFPRVEQLKPEYSNVGALVKNKLKEDEFFQARMKGKIQLHSKRRNAKRASKFSRADPGKYQERHVLSGSLEKTALMIMDEEIGQGSYVDEEGNLCELRLRDEYRQRFSKTMKDRTGSNANTSSCNPRKDKISKSIRKREEEANFLFHATKSRLKLEKWP